MRMRMGVMMMRRRKSRMMLLHQKAPVEKKSCTRREGRAVYRDN